MKIMNKLVLTFVMFYGYLPLCWNLSQPGQPYSLGPQDTHD